MFVTSKKTVFSFSNFLKKKQFFFLFRKTVLSTKHYTYGTENNVARFIKLSTSFKLLNMSANPYARSDFDPKTDHYDQWSPLLLEQYLKSHGNMREMVRHQLDTYEYFINVQEEETIQSMNPILIKSDEDQVSQGKYKLELRVYLQNLKNELPKIQESDGECKLLFPSEARVRNISYCSRQTIQFRLEYLRRNEDGEEIEKKTVLLPDMFFMNMYVMYRSSLCNTKVFPQLSCRTINECAVDPGGYFIIKGQEKTIMHHLGRRNNVLMILEGGPNHKYTYHASIKYIQEGSYGTSKQVDMYVMTKSNLVGQPLMVSTPRMREKEFINLFVMFRALGARSDLEIMNFIFDPSSVDDEQRVEIEKYLFATRYAAPKEVIDQISAIQYLKNSIDFDVNHYLKEDANDRRRLNQTLSMLRDEIFPQYRYNVAMVVNVHNDDIDQTHQALPSSSTSYKLVDCTHGRQEKMLMLGYIAKHLIWTALGWIEPDSRDSYLNKRMNGVNVIFNDFMRPHLHKVLKNMQTQMNKHYRKERRKALAAQSELVLENLFNRANMTKMFRSFNLQRQFDKAMQTGDFSTTGYAKRAGYCQQLKRLSMLDAIGHLRRISTNPDKNNEEVIENRKLDLKQVGHLCLLETPDTNAVGQILQLAIGSHASLFSSPFPLQRTLDELASKVGITKVGDIHVFAQVDRKGKEGVSFHQQTKLFVNGVWTALVKQPNELFMELKQRKCTGKLHVHISIVFDYPRNELRISTESGRTVRPVLRVKDGKIMLTALHLQLLRAKQLDWSDLVTGGHLFPEGIIEYIDAEEQWYSSISIPCVEITNSRKTFDYAEISYTFLQGFCASLIPYIGMNPSARNTYMTNIGKQPVGHFVTNYATRMDRTSYVQMFPGTPIVRTQMYTMLDLQYVPCGKQVNMALMCHDGTNQEDSMTMNADSADRGLFAGFMYHTEKEEDKSVINEQFLHTKPDPSVTIGMKHANYEPLNKFGLINPNQVVHPNTAYLAKQVPVSGVKAHARSLSQHGENKAILYEDHSHIHTRTPEDAYVQSNYVGRGGEGQLLVKTTLRMFRTPCLGDKFATRQAQKVTLGRKTPGFAMPYCMKTGLIPDIIYNMHCLPTRMTVATVKELSKGKLCVTIGAYANASQMDQDSNSPFADLQRLSSSVGLNPQLQDVMVNPQTGRILEVMVLSGPILENNLKHQTIEKAHCRNIGPNVKQTRQPTEGRSRDGGTKYGEMERDASAGCGTLSILQDRMFECSDKFTVYVCKSCGLIMAGNNGQEYFQGRQFLKDANVSSSTNLMFRKEFNCKLCENRSNVALLQIPYACKLFTQEQMSINVVPRFIT